MITISGSVGAGGTNKQTDVALVQYLINANIHRLIPIRPLAVDGLSGPATEGAISYVRRRLNLASSRRAGAVFPGDAMLTTLASALGIGAPPNLTAQFESLRHKGRAKQMAIGRITVNQRVYVFVSGGHGRGHLPPGDYAATKHRDSRTEVGFSSDGVGFTFALSDKADPRVGGVSRTLLRIHPDGGVLGTKGCIGILGAAVTQTAFKLDMKTELSRVSAGGGSFKLTVRGIAR